ncbi:flagellar biosynthesis protein FlhF [Pelomonas sp. V22]|uniref:flagellar biosynthesis protein FlhF n=1 Tax=Pelomonas sp. V22 TaxID=2822139 RepID=UPI0024A9EE41|nr:flagellar biosynthesis protein FlhF [Pelomonas sp. V22]MDI4633780.1 flagellar biosynthesis protein FlhF [Pelomonas sp. V22]
MNVKRFTARTSREALALVRQAFGDEAVVLSNKPCAAGVEVLAMAPEGMAQIEKAAASAPRAEPRSPSRVQARPADLAPARSSLRGRTEPSFAASAAEVGEDVQTLAMSTLSFQDYVRERMLKRRQAELSGQPDPLLQAPPTRPAAPELPDDVTSLQAARRQRAEAALRAMQPRQTPAPAPEPAPRRITPPVLRDEIRIDMPSVPTLAERDAGRGRREQQDMMNELRSMKGLIEERFGALAFMEKLQRQPAQAQLTQKLLEVGFSPALVRKLVEGLPADHHGPDETAWAANVLSRNLVTDEAAPPLEEQGGVFALIGSTGVGKTTTTAKIAAAFATRFGAVNLGLITLDAYRVGAHEQLRAYGRILGVPVHTAHDRASLEDLLELLASKKMVLIDTAGMAQRDSRTAELLDMLTHRSIRKLLVVNAAQQGETIDDVVTAWRGADAYGVLLSKIDEAVRLAPALDTMIRHKLKVVAVTNGQRVPEDWHRLSSPALVQRALRSVATPAWRMDASDVNLIFAGGPALSAAANPNVHAQPMGSF